MVILLNIAAAAVTISIALLGACYFLHLQTEAKQLTVAWLRLNDSLNDEVFDKFK